MVNNFHLKAAGELFCKTEQGVVITSKKEKLPFELTVDFGQIQSGWWFSMKFEFIVQPHQADVCTLPFLRESVHVSVHCELLQPV